MTPPPSVPASAEIMRAEAMAAYTPAILEPLVARMAEQDGVIRDQAETIGRQAERVAGLERENGELKAENHALLASTAPQPAEPSTEASVARPSPATWLTPRRFWIIAALVLVLIGVGMVQVAVAVYSLAVQLAMPG